VYVDSSAYVKLVLGEPQREPLRIELSRWGGAVSSALLGVEAVRACARYGAAYATRAREGLSLLSLVPIDEAVLTRASELAPPTLRSLDAIHIATALSLGADFGVLIAYDQRLSLAATDNGLSVVSPA
jgi:predicted nucleic acid-binding protein